MNYSTPGKQNSQYNEGGLFTNSFSLEKSFFSPNNDGINDVLILHYSLPSQPKRRTDRATLLFEKSDT